MNLHAIAAPIAAIVNPPQLGTWWQNTGYVTTEPGMRVPNYNEVPDQSFQVQALRGDDLKLVEGLNIQGVMRSVHMFGLPKAVDRKTGSGGDLLEFLGSKWLVTLILETWDSSGWSRVAVTKQIDAT